MGFGVDTRDVVLTTLGVAALVVPMAWLTHTCCCPDVFITELIEADGPGAVPSDCSPTRPQIKEQCHIFRTMTPTQHSVNITYYLYYLLLIYNYILNVIPIKMTIFLFGGSNTSRFHETGKLKSLCAVLPY